MPEDQKDVYGDETRHVIPGYETLPKSIRDRIDAKLKKMAAKRDRGEEITLADIS